MRLLRLLWLAMASFPLLAGAAVNLNTAGQEELETLDGVGPKKAQAILAYRKQHGPFGSVDELDHVPGFGPKTIAALRQQVTLTGRPPPPAKPGVATPQRKPSAPATTQKPATTPPPAPKSIKETAEGTLVVKKKPASGTTPASPVTSPASRVPPPRPGKG